MISNPEPLVPGEDPSPLNSQLVNVACSCGELHENNRITWEPDDLKLATHVPTGEAIFGKFRRCKTCKEWLIVRRHNENSGQ